MRGDGKSLCKLSGLVGAERVRLTLETWSSQNTTPFEPMDARFLLGSDVVLFAF